MLAIEKLPEIMEIRTPVKFAFCFVKKYFRHFDQWSSRFTTSLMIRALR
jgi:hypothetical protein